METTTKGCPCGFGQRPDLGTFSVRWHTMHRDHHLARFPDVDQGTRDNLDMFIRIAEERAAAPA
jgi:hypothetical protein